MSVSTAKAALRVRYAQLRAEWTNTQRETMHRALTEAVTALPAFLDVASALLCYASRPDETDTWGILRIAWRSGKTVALPRCEGHGSMAFYSVPDENALQKGMFGILEPSAACTLYIPKAHDLCIVPGLAFDRSGHRLGYGGGYYDRYLSAHPIFTVGICYPNCLTSALPTEPFDIPVRQVICHSDEQEA